MVDEGEGEGEKGEMIGDGDDVAVEVGAGDVTGLIGDTCMGITVLGVG